MSCPMVSFTFIAQEGDSAVMLAARGGQTDIVVELVKAGAKLDLQNVVRNYINHTYPSHKNEQP